MRERILTFIKAAGTNPLSIYPICLLIVKGESVLSKQVAGVRVVKAVLLVPGCLVIRVRLHVLLVPDFCQPVEITTGRGLQTFRLEIQGSRVVIMILVKMGFTTCCIHYLALFGCTDRRPSEFFFCGSNQMSKAPTNCKDKINYN